jgi:hypothetical protein
MVLARRKTDNKQAHTHKYTIFVGKPCREKKKHWGILGFDPSVILKIYLRETIGVELPLHYDFRIFFSIHMQQFY